jgi:hypothetical protein
MRLGDLQKSAINMLNVIKRTAAFNTLYEKLVAADAALQANKASEAQAAAQAAQAAAEKAQADAQTAQASAETAKAAAEKAQAAAEAALAKAEALNQGTSATTTVKTTLKLAKKKLSLKVGKKAKIVAVASTDDKITYKSTNKKVATVTAKGVVKGKKKGTAVIKVTCNGVTKKVKVTVK